MPFQSLSVLNSEEADLLFRAPAMVTLMIAGADERVSKKEISWAKKLVDYRSHTAEAELQEYYEHAEKVFEAVLDAHSKEWSAEAEAGIIAEVTALKPVFDKLEENYALILKQSLRTLAKKVAEASGGIAGFGSVSQEERELINLPMLD